MRRALQLTLLSIFLTSALVAVVIGYVSIERITQDLIERELSIAHSAITNKFNLFDVLLRREEEAMDKRMDAALPIVAQHLLDDPEKLGEVSKDDLDTLSKQVGVDNVYIIDKKTVIVATNFAPDLGFELGKISDGFRSFLQGLIGTGKFVADRINMSSKTGILTKYGYLSPKGSDHIAEVSIRVRDFLSRERSPEFVDFLFKSFFNDLVHTQEFLRELDIHMVNPVGRFSLFDRNSDLPEEIAKTLYKQERVTHQDGNLWTVYSKLSPVGTRLATAEFLAITTKFDFSDLAKRVEQAIIMLVSMMIIASTLAYIVAIRLATRYVIDRVEKVREGVSLISDGDYSHELIISGRDEINDIVDDINNMRLRIKEDIEKREEFSNELKQAMDDARMAHSFAEGQAQDLVELAEKQAVLNEQLKYEVNVKNRFFSIISHDLKSPFTSLLGMTQIMSQMADSFSKEKLVDYANNVNEAGERVFELLHNLLEWSRLQMEGAKIELKMIPLDQLAQECIDILKPIALEKDIALTNKIKKTEAFADQEMVRTVIRNLIANSLKFTPSGGTVQVLSRGDGDMVQVTVRDTGVGMSTEQAKKIFSLDQKTSTTGTAGEKGTGLGLPLCKDMLERNGGRIWVESAPGEGSQFHFTLPIGPGEK